MNVRIAWKREPDANALAYFSKEEVLKYGPLNCPKFPTNKKEKKKRPLA